MGDNTMKIGVYAHGYNGRTWRCCSVECAIETGLPHEVSEVKDTPGCEHCLNCGSLTRDTPCVIHDEPGTPPGFSCPYYSAEATRLHASASIKVVAKVGDPTDDDWDYLARLVRRNPRATPSAIAEAVVKRHRNR